MTDISASIRALTIADAGVSALIGTRMYSDDLLQNVTIPAVRYVVVEATPYEELVNVTNVARVRIQIDAFGNTRGEANAVGQAITSVLQKFRGMVGTQMINEINVATGAIDDLLMAGGRVVIPRVYISSQDFFVTYRLN